MQIGLSTSNMFDRLGIDGGFQALHDAGFDCVDFGLDWYWQVGRVLKGERDFILSKPLDEVIEFFRPYKEAADRHHVAIHQAHAPFPSYVSGQPEFNLELLEIIKKCVALCEFFECRYLIVHPAFNSHSERMEFDEEWNVNIDLYTKLIPALKAHNVICCLENMFTGFNRKVYEGICSDPNEAAAYIDELNEIAGEKRFAFCYDTGHGLLLGKDPYGTLIQLGDRVETLHIHDNDGIEDLHVMPYSGRLDWERFIKGLKAIHYQGALCFESSNSLQFFPLDLAPEVLRLMASTGKYFEGRLQEE